MRTKFFALVAVLVISLLCPVPGLARDVDAKHLSDFSSVIRMQGYQCSTADKGETYGQLGTRHGIYDS
jgi:hypothetical protein